MAALVLAPGTGEAIPITFSFSGVVTEVTTAPPGIGPGTGMTGSYSFESSTPDALPSNPTIGDYENALLSIELFIGGTHAFFTTVGPRVTSQMTVDDADFSAPRGGGDSYRVRGDSFIGLVDGLPINGLLGFRLDLGSNFDSLWNSDSLPLSPRSVEAFDTRLRHHYQRSRHPKRRGRPVDFNHP